MLLLLEISEILVGLVIYYLRPRWFFLYWLVAVTFFTPLICFVAGVTDTEETGLVIHRGYFLYLNTIVLIDSILRKKSRHLSLSNVLIFMGVLCFYFVLQGILTSGSLRYIYLNIKGVYLILLPLLILTLNEETRPLIKDVKNLLWVILILEVLATLLNMHGVFFFVASYFDVTFAEGKMTGTFAYSQQYGNFITGLFVFLCIDYFSRRKLPKLSFFILSSMCLFCILASGSRMCFAVAVISLFVIVFLYQKNNKFLFILLIIFGFIGLQFLSNYSGKEISSNDGINRIVDGLASFSQSKKDGDDDHSTVRLSEKLLDAYFLQSPLIGNGLAASNKEYSYVINDSFSKTRELMADARLAFLIVDIGLIGVMLYLYLFYIIFKYIGRYLPLSMRRSLIVSFVFYLIFTVTESGFWDGFVYPLVYIYFFAVIREIKNNTNPIILTKPSDE